MSNELLKSHIVINIVVSLRYMVSRKGTLDCSAFSLVHTSSFLLSFAAGNLRTMSESAAFSTVNPIWGHRF